MKKFIIAQKIVILISALCTVLVAKAQTQSVLVYYTGFEPEEGYDYRYTLIGQGGWAGIGDGWNGLIADPEYFPGFGQQAYLGYSTTTNYSEYTIIWRPLNFQNLTNYPILKFSVVMQIKNSTNQRFDDFRWSVYNLQEQRLFSIDFDNETKAINYSLDKGGEFYATGFTFFNDGTYELEIAMNFARNRWVAIINGVQIVQPQPITTTGLDLNIGDIDAVWVPHNPSEPGNNYLVFDEFKVTAESPVFPPRLLPVSYTLNSNHILKLLGEPAINYALEISTDLRSWTAVFTNIVPYQGVINFTNTNIINKPVLFYRARLIP